MSASQDIPLALRSSVTVADEQSGLLAHAADNSLPKGAAPPSPLPVDANTPRSASSPGLLGELPSAQYATYPPGENVSPWLEKEAHDVGIQLKPWVPLPLQLRFWAPFVALLFVGAIILEVALHFSNKNQGWAVSDGFSSTAGFLHYVYILPPVIVAMTTVAMLTWTDIAVKKMQPYVDLVHGNSPPHRSLLLDYTRTSNFVVWTMAAANRHYLVALTTLMVLVSLTLQPLSAALITIRDTWIAEPDVTLNTLAAVGLNQNPQFQDLTVFLSAAGFASASALYQLNDPPFTHGQWTISPFQIPTAVASNGTVSANTTAILSDSGCQGAQISMALDANAAGWTTTATRAGCSASFHVDQSAPNFFGTQNVSCQGFDPTLPQFLPVIFWFFTYQPQAAASAAFCFPTIQLFDVNVHLDLASGNITEVTELGPFTGTSNFSSLSANVTGAPLNGRAYNGIAFNLTNSNSFITQRLNAIQLSLPAAIFQAAESSPQGLAAVFTSDNFVQYSSQVYTTYLKLIARQVYFLPSEQPLTMQVRTFRKRLWLSGVAVHLLTTALLLLSAFGTIMHLLHRRERRDLRLAHEPGTIASAMSIGAQTNLGELLAGRQRPEDIYSALRDKKFRIDVNTMQVVMEGEPGYENATTPSQSPLMDYLLWAVVLNKVVPTHSIYQRSDNSSCAALIDSNNPC